MKDKKCGTIITIVNFGHNYLITKIVEDNRKKVRQFSLYVCFFFKYSENIIILPTRVVHSLQRKKQLIWLIILALNFTLKD